MLIVLCLSERAGGNKERSSVCSVEACEGKWWRMHARGEGGGDVEADSSRKWEKNKMDVVYSESHSGGAGDIRVVQLMSSVRERGGGRPVCTSKLVHRPPKNHRSDV